MAASVLDPQTQTQSRLSGGGSGTGGAWKIIVLNDDFNTFDGVAESLAATLPSVSLADGYRFASQIDGSGQAIVWSGPKDEAETYWEQLNDCGLTLSPLDQG